MKRDYCNKEGAEYIRKRLFKVWEKQGYCVNIFLLKGGFTAALRTSRIDVRSDMINGLPRKRLPADSDPKIT